MDASIDVDSNHKNVTWAETCMRYDENTNAPNTSTNTNNTTNNTNFVLRKVTGPGVRKGLSVIMDTLECGWHSTSIFDGVKVKEFITVSYIFNALLDIFLEIIIFLSNRF